MKKLWLSMVAVLIFLGGCADDIPASSNKIKVVTSFYPLYEIATQVGGDFVEVKNLVPAGAEPHDYELTPKDIASIYGSQILVVNGAGLEPWFERIAADLQKSSLTHVLDASKLFYDLFSAHYEGFVNGNSPSTYDPHVWLDPVRYETEVEAFYKILIEVDPVHKDYYFTRAKDFMQKISDLGDEYKTGFNNCSSRTFVVNHAAFSYLAVRYQLSAISIAGLSPDAEPSSKTIAQLIESLRQRNIKYVLTESLVSTKIADIIAQEVGAKTLVLNPLEGLTDEEIAQGQNYISVMQQNLKNLQIAMECKGLSQ